jgi:hypothetical protein
VYKRQELSSFQAAEQLLKDIAENRHLEQIKLEGEHMRNHFGQSVFKAVNDYIDDGPQDKPKLVRLEDGLIMLKNGGMLSL